MLLLKRMLAKLFLPSNVNLTVIKKNDTDIFYLYNAFYFYKLAFKRTIGGGQVDNETNGICV